jgi:hypothetical protein
VLVLALESTGVAGAGTGAALVFILVGSISGAEAIDHPLKSGPSR